MLSLLVRRVHMYLALFLMPWLAMYALAAMAMNHRDYFIRLYDGNLWKTELESTRDYQPDLPPDINDEDLANRILDELELAGPHVINRSAGGRQLNIVRDDPLAAREISYVPDEHKLTVKKFPLRPATTLVRLHHRHGFKRTDSVSLAWAVGADIAAIGMVVWVATGVWLWWEIKSARRWGVACLALGLGAFAAFLILA